MTDGDLSLQVTNPTIDADGNVVDPLATPITPGVPQHIAKRAKLSQDEELEAEGELHAPIDNNNNNNGNNTNDMTMADDQQEQNIIDPNEKVCLTPSSNDTNNNTTTAVKATVDVEIDKPITLQKGITIHTLRKMLNNKHPVFGNHTQQDALRSE
eukprot:UN09467